MSLFKKRAFCFQLSFNFFFIIHLSFCSRRKLHCSVLFVLVIFDHKQRVHVFGTRSKKKLRRRNVRYKRREAKSWHPQVLSYQISNTCMNYFGTEMEQHIILIKFGKQRYRIFVSISVFVPYNTVVVIATDYLIKKCVPFYIDRSLIFSFIEFNMQARTSSCCLVSLKLTLLVLNGATNEIPYKGI